MTPKSVLCFPMTKGLKGNLKPLGLAAVSQDPKDRNRAFNRQLRSCQAGNTLKGNFQEQKCRVEIKIWKDIHL